jgi:S1-C subfamily serine protease
MTVNNQIPNLGGLSGGPVIDTNGDVVGIVSNVKPNPDGSGVLFAPADITQAVASLRRH